VVKTVTDFPVPIKVIEEGLWIPVSSGYALAARLWLPVDADQKPVPALLEFLPYRKGDIRRARDETIHHFFAGFGYASIRVDLRGSGDSFGVMRDEYEPQEHDDAVDVIAWLASQNWCNGRVGMFGSSWGGFNALQVAARRPAALKAIITACSTDNRYTDDMHFMGGCLLNDNLDWGTYFLSILPLPGDPRIMGKEWRTNWHARMDAIEPPVERWMKHPTWDAYWKYGSISEDYSAISCPVFAIGGWLDGYKNAVFRLLEHLKVPRLGLIGPQAHTWPYDDKAPGPAYGFLQEALRWWDYWLKDVPTGIMSEPMLRAYLGDDIPASSWYALCPGRWIGETEWPSRHIGERMYYLTALGLRDEPRQGDVTTHWPSQTIGLAAGEWCPYGTGGDGPEFAGDQRSDDALSAAFDSNPLPERLEILGAPVVEIELAVDRPSAFIAVRLNDVKPSGAATRVSLGILNLTHRNGSESPQPLHPGQRYRVRVVLSYAAYSFAPGHRLRISISTCYWPMVWPSPDPVKLDIFSEGSVLKLPVRPITLHEPLVRSLDEPLQGPRPRLETIQPPPRSNLQIRNLITGSVELTSARGAGFYRIVDNDIEAGGNMLEHFCISDADPLSATAEISATAKTGRPGSSIDVDARSRLTSDREAFHLETSLDVRENGEVVFSREWRSRIPRRLL
jgi:uncharacterized protein